MLLDEVTIRFLHKIEFLSFLIPLLDPDPDG